MTDRASCVVLRALCAAVVFSLGVGAAFAQSWKYSNGILTGEDGMKLNATLSNGEVSVTGISDRGALTTIDLRGTVTDADAEATYTIVSAKGIKYSGLKELYLPETLRYLGSFDGCSTLEKVEPMFPAALTGFEGYTFRSCSKLKGDVKFVNPSFTTTAYSMFEKSGITSVDFTGCTLTTLDSWFCNGCTSLTNVTPFLPPTVTSMGNSVFGGCTKLPGELVLGNAALKAIPDSMINSTLVTSVDLGASPIEKVGASAFYNCYNLTNVTPFLPPTVTSIGNYAFRGCSSLTNALVLSNPGFTVLNDQAFNYCRKIPSVNLTGTAITSIGAYCFQECDSCKDFRPLLPDTVKTIGAGAFSKLPATNFIYLSSSLTMTTMPSIFSSCACAGIDMSQTKITTFNTGCFQYAGFKKVLLPPTTDNIGFDAFRGINASQGIFFCGPPPPTIDQRAFIGIGDPWTIRGSYVFPREYKAEWEEYVANDPCLATTLTAAEQAKFNIPGLRKPKQKLRMNKNQNDSYDFYLCWWWMKPPGMMMIVR